MKTGRVSVQDLTDYYNKEKKPVICDVFDIV